MDCSTIKNNWQIGSKCEIYSRSQQKWRNGLIIKIFKDDQGEWLVIKYGNFCKEIQRNSDDIRPIIQNDVYDDGKKLYIKDTEMMENSKLKQENESLQKRIHKLQETISFQAAEIMELKQKNKNHERKIEEYELDKKQELKQMNDSTLEVYKYRINHIEEADFRDRFGSKGNFALIMAYIRMEMEDKHKLFIPNHLKWEFANIYEKMYTHNDGLTGCISWIYDETNDVMIQQCIAKNINSINLVDMNYLQDGVDRSTDKKPGLFGGKAFDTKGCSCGVIELGPGAKKNAEIAYWSEQFFVHQCEDKKILYTLGDEEFYLSKGSLFVAPSENEYSICNLSKIYPATLIFMLIKGSIDHHVGFQP